VDFDLGNGLVRLVASLSNSAVSRQLHDGSDNEYMEGRDPGVVRSIMPVLTLSLGRSKLPKQSLRRAERSKKSG
jgi:hypothetical protein